MDKIKIKKRNGKTEPWMYDKVLASVGKTGISLELAEDITNKVEDWVVENAKKGLIDSVEVKNKLIELIKEADPAAGDNYQAYKAS